jgi:hypothetical protein
MKRLLMAAACAVALAAPAGAAEIWSVKDGCHDTSGRPCYLIHIKGEIQLEDWKQFQDVVRRDNISNALVVLDSYGGNVLGGMSIGLTIRDREFDTYVGKGATCASMCGGIWLAGHTRYAFPDSRIGFHQPSIKDKRGNNRTDPRMVSFMKDYYFKVGASKEAASFLTAAHADEMYWLNSHLARGLDINFVEVPLYKPEEVRTFCERSLTYDIKVTARTWLRPKPRRSASASTSGPSSPASILSMRAASTSRRRSGSGWRRLSPRCHQRSYDDEEATTGWGRNRGPPLARWCSGGTQRRGALLRVYLPAG